MAGAATIKHHIILQSSIAQKKKVTMSAPTGKNICKITEYFCLFLFYTNSEQNRSVILRTASPPNPLKNKPTLII